MLKPKFSIIGTHYDKAISDEGMMQCLESVDNQTCQDFEILLYHDGPLSRPLPSFDHLKNKPVFKATKKRYNDWGHSLRDLGIKEAQGEWIIHLSIDNTMFETALEDLVNSMKINEDFARESDYPPETKKSFDIIIAPIIMEGCIRRPVDLALTRTKNPEHKLIFEGIPPKVNNVDLFQFVAKRDLWVREGGWYDKRETGDGYMIEELTQKYGCTYCNNIIGIHR